MRGVCQSKHRKDSNFLSQIPCLQWLPPFACFQPSRLFQRRFLQDPGLSTAFFQALHHSGLFIYLFISHSAFSWRNLSTPEKPASDGFVCFLNSRARLTSPSIPHCKICCPLLAWRRSGCDACTVLHSLRGEICSQAGDEGLQMADRPSAANTASNLELHGVAVRDSRMTFLLSRQKVCLG